MIVSFDLDDTLFVSPESFQVEHELSFPFNRIYRERLRLGTIELMTWLREQGIHIWIYTTSFRTERYIRRLFNHYGIKLDSVVNGYRHAKEVQAGKTEAMPSKYPGKYRIDLHIDDDISVAKNGQTYGFKVFIVGEDDDLWVKKLEDEIQIIRKRIGEV